MALLGAACEDDYKNYPDGYDRQYYTTFDYESDDQGNPTLTNRTISVDRSSTELIELPIKFMSETERDYDIEVRLYVRNSPYFLTQMGVMKPPKNEFSTPDSLAVPGVDFHILDRDKRVMTPVRRTRSRLCTSGPYRFLWKTAFLRDGRGKRGTSRARCLHPRKVALDYRRDARGNHAYSRHTP